MIYDRYGRQIYILHVCNGCNKIVRGNGLKEHLIQVHNRTDLQTANRNTAYSRIRKAFRRYRT